MRIEQILPTLATKDDLAAAVRPLATRAEMHAEVAEVRAEIREEGERTRRYFDAVAERLETRIQLIAEGYGALHEQLNAFRADVKADLAALDRRLMRLEAR